MLFKTFQRPFGIQKPFGSLRKLLLISTNHGKKKGIAEIARNITENRGATDQVVLEQFFEAGWTNENLIDTISFLKLLEITVDCHLLQPTIE